MHVSVHALLLLSAFGCLAGAVIASRWFQRNFERPQFLRAAVAAAATLIIIVNTAAMMWTHAATEMTGVAVGLATLTVLGAIASHLRIAGEPVRHPRRVLAIGAHPDDLELACGGTLAKFSDSGHEMHTLVMSNGQRGGDASARPGEAVRGGGFMRTSTVQVLDFPDTELGSVAQEMVAAIEGAILRFNPDIVLTHSGNDQHQDHHAVHLATLRAARQHPSILCYESPSATRDFNPSVYIDIDDYVEVKVHAVSLHRNQAGKPYMTPTRVRGVAAFRGAQAKRAYAEAYEPVRLLDSAFGAGS